MEIIYTAYIREVNNQPFYFVKRFTSFSQLKNVDPVLDTMGMHKNFYRACDLANVFDPEIIKNLYNELHIIPESATEGQSGNAKSILGSIIKNAHHALARIRIAGL